MKKISIIIPVYNVEEYLDECLESIEKQSIGIENIEVIIVNDGSKDNSMKVVEKYSEKYNDWIIINRENRGVSRTRNEGIEKATANYLMFLDSDDYLSQDALKEMYDIALKEDCDVVLGRMKAFDSKGYYGYYSDRIITKYEVFDLYKKKNVVKLTSVCCKLYRTDLVKNISFPPNLKHEDNYFSLSVYIKAKKIVSVPKYYYYRRYREGENLSIMQSLSLSTFRDLVENYRLFFKDNQKNNIIITFSLKTFNNYIISRLAKNDKLKAKRLVKDYLIYLLENDVIRRFEYIYYNVYHILYYSLASVYYKLIKITKK